MALSERKKDVILDIKDDTPNVIVRNHEWPNALPDAINQIVITYFEPSIEEVKELDKHFRQLKNETMAPFRNAIESKIVPLLNEPTLARIYQSKPSKSKWNFVENNAVKLLDGLIEQMDYLPADEQLEFLCSIYDGNWGREEKGNFKQVKERLKKLHESFTEFKEIEAFQTSIAQIIFEKLNSFIRDTITYPYQASQASRIRYADDNNRVVIIGESVEQLLQQEQGQVNIINEASRSSYGCYIMLFAAGGFLLGIGFASESKPVIYTACGLLGFGLLFSIRLYLSDRAKLRHQNQTNILQSAVTHGLFRSASEAKSDNNSLTESLLTPEQQAEYKEENEESNSQPDSPRRGRGQ